MMWFGVLLVLFLAAYASASLSDRRDELLAKAAGRPKTEFLRALGQPTSVSAMAQGRTLLQWQRKGDHVAVMFKGDVCEGVTHHHSAKGVRA